MKSGDIVRFRLPYWKKVAGGEEGKEPDSTLKNKIGLLVEYEQWNKMATILYEGSLLRVPGRDVEKSGRKDLETWRSRSDLR